MTKCGICNPCPNNDGLQCPFSHGGAINLVWLASGMGLRTPCKMADCGELGTLSVYPCNDTL